MTQKQKAARDKFKKVVVEAGKLRKKNPSLTQAQAVKQAWAISYSKAGTTKKTTVTKKKAALKKKVDVKKKAVAKKKVAVKKVALKKVATNTKNKKRISGLPIGQGDYLVSTWGYDQTNVDFYYVTKVSKGSAYIIPASQKVVEFGDMQGKVVPKEPNFNENPVRRKIKKYSGGEYISLNTFSIARKWEGNPVFYSSYA